MIPPLRTVAHITQRIQFRPIKDSRIYRLNDCSVFNQSFEYSINFDQQIAGPSGLQIKLILVGC